ncbi:MAG: ABC transporter ATP-binding protein/permease [Synergistaceae bacterium]|jgi:ATP-binding cassette subfamily B protein|nr:ABC transporter ATP-binding protein/permease [Synergistaceae bacterium]
MPTTENRRSLALLWELSLGGRALYFFSFASMLAAIFCSFLLPQVVRFVVDSVIGGLPVADMPVLTALIEKTGLSGSLQTLRENRALIALPVLGIAVGGGILGFAAQRGLACAAEGLVRRLRDRLYSHIQRLPYEWHIGIQTGDIVQRCTSDVEVVRSFVSSQLIEIVRTLALIAFACVILFSMNTTLALASFAFLPVVFLYSFLFLRRATARFLDADEAEGQLLATAQENFTGVRVVRAFGRERYEVDRFDRQNRHYAELWMLLGKMLSTYWGLGDLLTGLQMITICVAGAWQAADGGVTVGEFIVFLTCSSMTIWPVRNLGRVLSEASKTGVSLGRIQEILDTPPETDPPNALETPTEGDIEFDHVSFSYGDAPVLHDVSFTVKRGTTFGILGATGSGKTTIAHLLCRLYDLGDREGEIRIGGVDIRKYRRSWLRENVGIVLQEPYLYSRTIRENVASLSVARYPVEKIREAASTAQMDDAIEQFSSGYETLVGERGVTLSGGQKQRVAIARTILRKPPIMIFDDSLSAVDTETDAKIRMALRQQLEGVTTIIIAHRIASISGADRIMVMENGRVAEIGSPAELMERDGIYRRIRRMQQNAEDEIENESAPETRKGKPGTEDKA